MIAIAQPRIEFGTRAEAREKEIKRCLKMNPTYILMMDSDQTMPIRGLNAMINTGADISCIDAPSKGRDDSNVRCHPNGDLYIATISCCLIKPYIFKFLEEPWFNSKVAVIEERVKDGKIIYRYEQKYQDDNVGEDAYFIRKAIEAGFRVEVVSNMKCKHFDLEAI